MKPYFYNIVYIYNRHSDQTYTASIRKVLEYNLPKYRCHSNYLYCIFKKSLKYIFRNIGHFLNVNFTVQHVLQSAK